MAQLSFRDRLMAGSVLTVATAAFLATHWPSFAVADAEESRDFPTHAPVAITAPSSGVSHTVSGFTSNPLALVSDTILDAAYDPRPAFIILRAVQIGSAAV